LLPNPAVNEVVLTFAPLLEDAELIVRDARGRLVASTRLGAGAAALQMDVSAWAGGTYVFELPSGTAPQHVRLMLVR
jgi:hypothetical protein